MAAPNARHGARRGSSRPAQIASPRRARLGPAIGAPSSWPPATLGPPTIGHVGVRQTEGVVDGFVVHGQDNDSWMYERAPHCPDCALVSNEEWVECPVACDASAAPIPKRCVEAPGARTFGEKFVFLSCVSGIGGRRVSPRRAGGPREAAPFAVSTRCRPALARSTGSARRHMSRCTDGGLRAPGSAVQAHLVDFGSRREVEGAGAEPGDNRPVHVHVDP